MRLLRRSSINPIYFMVLSVVGLLLLLPSVTRCETNHDLNRFVISKGDVEGFTVIKGPDYYGPESLWNYINGGALPYLDYGVRDVVTYTGMWSPGNLEIVVDVYDMADSLGAFGIYSNERFPEYTFINIGVEGYLTENALCFWKDRYYIKVFSNEDSSSILSPIERIAHTVDKRIPAGGGMPRYFSLFPDKDRLERTEAYIAKNVLGQDYLKNTFVVNYRRRDEEFQLYLIEAPDADEAARQLHEYREFIREFGKLENMKADLGDETFIGEESWYGLMVFVQKGAFILGSVGLSDRDLARAHLSTMLSGLSR
jgi:hypothetical protein